MPQTSEEFAQARLAYSREKEDRDRPGKGEGDWMCEVVGPTGVSLRNKMLTVSSAAWRITSKERFVLGAMLLG
jgi:hypothetical protein